MSFTANAGVEVDALHPRTPMDLSSELCNKIFKCLHKSVMAGKWPSRASTTLSILIPKTRNQ